MKKIILFDGVCNLCNQSVQFIMKRDPHHQFQFASLQSEKGQELITQYQIPSDIDSILLLEDNEYFTKSTAALKIAKILNSPLRYFYFCIIFPRIIRDWLYDLIANNRYKLFGKNTTCMIPKPGDKDRFLD
nr:thiol-disulfide oxidoreductase DCC family protein [Gracilibacillus sp. YIM 98692]